MGQSHTNKNLQGKPTPRIDFFLPALAQFFTLQGILDGVIMQGTPRGQHLGMPCRLDLNPGEKPNFGVIDCVGLAGAAGHPHIHTHIFM